MSNLLGGIFSNVIQKNFGTGNTSSLAWLKPIATFLDNLLIPFIIIVLIAGAAWVIVLGVGLAKAEDTGKAQEAKKKLINVAIALVSVIVLVFLLTFLAANLPGWFENSATNNPWSDTAQSGTQQTQQQTQQSGTGIIHWFLR